MNAYLGAFWPIPGFGDQFLVGEEKAQEHAGSVTQLPHESEGPLGIQAAIPLRRIAADAFSYSTKQGEFFLNSRLRLQAIPGLGGTP